MYMVTLLALAGTLAQDEVQKRRNSAMLRIEQAESVIRDFHRDALSMLNEALRIVMFTAGVCFRPPAHVSLASYGHFCSAVQTMFAFGQRFQRASRGTIRCSVYLILYQALTFHPKCNQLRSQGSSGA
jgi:hypothetical protein